MLRTLLLLFTIVFQLARHGSGGNHGNGGNGDGHGNDNGRTPGRTHGDTSSISSTQSTAQNNFRQGEPAGAGWNRHQSDAYLNRHGDRRGGRHQMSGDSLRHVVEGDLTRNNNPASPLYGEYRGTGYHHRPGGIDANDRRIGTPVAIDPNTGVYAARVEFRNPNYDPHNPDSGPEWIPKSGNQGQSSFFPDHWTTGEVDRATSDAFQNGTKDSRTGRWEGTYNGVHIEGAYDPSNGHLVHGWPKQ